MEAASPAREIVRTKKEESGSSRTAKARKGIAEAIETVNGSDATNPLIPQCNAEDTCLKKCVQNLVRLDTCPVSSAVGLNNRLQ